MKKLLALLLLLFSVSANAQKGAITFSFSYGTGNGQRKPIAEMAGFSSEGPIKTFDLALSRMISDHVTLESGGFVTQSSLPIHIVRLARAITCRQICKHSYCASKIKSRYIKIYIYQWWLSTK